MSLEALDGEPVIGGVLVTHDESIESNWTTVGVWVNLALTNFSSFLLEE